MKQIMIGSVIKIISIKLIGGKQGLERGREASSVNGPNWEEIQLQHEQPRESERNGVGW